MPAQGLLMCWWRAAAARSSPAAKLGPGRCVLQGPEPGETPIPPGMPQGPTSLPAQPAGSI